jgi:cytochrome P450
MVYADVPESEKSLLRLQDEAQTFIGGGVVTTSWTLTVGTFHVLNNPSVYGELKKELRAAIPEDMPSDRAAQLDWTQLEKLPYLTGVVKEAVRLSAAISGRNPRVSTNPIQYKDWTIPPGTPIAMSIPFINKDESIFTDAASFKPERWQGLAKAPNGQSLERYFVSFGKGSRSCLGIK